MAKKTSTAVKELVQDVNNKVKEDQLPLSSTYVETNCIGFDLGLTDGKGIPTGSMILMYADPGVGKTTITADILYRILTTEKDNDKVKGLYIDTEGSRELLRAMGLGEFIDNGKLIMEDTHSFGGSISFEKLEQVFTDVIENKNDKYKNVRYIVIDSLSGVTSKTLLEAKVDKADFGSNAKERERFYRKYVADLKLRGITCFFISQVRHNNEAQGMFSAKTKPAVSEFDMHWMDFIIRFTKKESASNEGIKKIKVLTSTGIQEVAMRYLLTMSTRGSLRKNRYGDMPDIDILVKRGERIINVFNVRNLLLNLDYITKYNNTKKLWKIKNPDLIPIIGIEDCTLDTEIPEKQLNSMIRTNIRPIKQFLKDRNEYKHVLVIGEDEDDGM